VVEQAEIEAVHKQAIQTAITKLVKAGYTNKDLAWQHVGFYYRDSLNDHSYPKRQKLQGEPELVAVMFDMQLEKISDEEEARDVMLRCLRLAITPPLSTHTLPAPSSP
jgi:hypothetical protein